MDRWKTGSLVVLIVALGLWVGNHLGHQVGEVGPGASQPDPPRPRRIHDPPPPTPKTAARPPRPPEGEDPTAPDGALPGQRWVTFDSAEAMRRFLASLHGSGITVLGSLDALNTLRLGVSDPDALAALLDGSEETGYIFPAWIPGQGSVQPGAVGFGSGFLGWLGADGDRSGWGKGVRIAVLDTGVAGAGTIASLLSSGNFVPLPDDASTMNSHGTAVASLIAGKDGLAPDATILDFRVARDDGSSDSFLIAEAVIAAADAGADIINLSLGSTGYSALLENALRYATDAGVLIVAAAGNNGIDHVLHPAASDRVIAVGAVDARGEHLDFSNAGEISIAAPGLDLTSFSTDGGAISFSGTSASTPVVVGAIATLMSLERLSAEKAWALLVDNANEAGAPGDDAFYGAGTLDLGRALEHDTPGIHDVAVAANHPTLDAQGNPRIQVTIENRGTTRIVNAPVTVTTPSGAHQLNVTTLAPGEVQTFELPLGSLSEGARIDSVVGLSGGVTDRNPADNRRVDVIVPPDSP